MRANDEGVGKGRGGGVPGRGNSMCECSELRVSMANSGCCWHIEKGKGLHLQMEPVRAQGQKGLSLHIEGFSLYPMIKKSFVDFKQRMGVMGMIKWVFKKYHCGSRFGGK